MIWRTYCLLKCIDIQWYRSDQHGNIWISFFDWLMGGYLHRKPRMSGYDNAKLCNNQGSRHVRTGGWPYTFEIIVVLLLWSSFIIYYLGYYRHHQNVMMIINITKKIGVIEKEQEWFQQFIPHAIIFITIFTTICHPNCNNTMIIMISAWNIWEWEIRSDTLCCCVERWWWMYIFGKIWNYTCCAVKSQQCWLQSDC